ncbi:MAG: BMP family ABC transporter substrate-binding protein [Myxococcota bacterium]
MNRTALVALTLLSTAALAATTPRARPTLQRAATQVGLVFDVGGRGDRGFKDAADQGLMRAASELGVKATVVEPRTDAVGALRRIVAEKPALAVGVGFTFSEPMHALAREFPGQSLVCVDYAPVDGQAMPPGLLGIRFKEQEGSFLVGALAALVSKGNKLGFVGGMDVPVIRRFQAGFLAGARHVRPDVEVKTVYVAKGPEGFASPGLGKSQALALYDQGVEIIFHASGATGLGVFEAAKERGKLVIGVDADQWSAAPGHVLTSMVKRVDTAVYDAIKRVQDGTFKGGVVDLDLKSGGVDYVYNENNRKLIPDDVRARVEALRGEIVAGKIVVPAQ